MYQIGTKFQGKDLPNNEITDVSNILKSDNQ